MLPKSESLSHKDESADVSTKRQLGQSDFTPTTSSNVPIQPSAAFASIPTPKVKSEEDSSSPQLRIATVHKISRASSSASDSQSEKPTRKRRNLCLCEQVKCNVKPGMCRELEIAAGEDHWLHGSMYQVPPSQPRCGVKIRERWLHHLGISEEILEVKKILKPEIRWTHFPLEFFKNSPSVKQPSAAVTGTSKSDSKPKRRRLKYVVEKTLGTEPEDIITEAKHEGMAVPTPLKRAIEDSVFLHSQPSSAQEKLPTSLASSDSTGSQAGFFPSQFHQVRSLAAKQSNLQTFQQHQQQSLSHLHLQPSTIHAMAMHSLQHPHLYLPGFHGSHQHLVSPSLPLQHMPLPGNPFSFPGHQTQESLQAPLTSQTAQAFPSSLLLGASQHFQQMHPFNRTHPAFHQPLTSHNAAAAFAAANLSQNPHAHASMFHQSQPPILPSPFLLSQTQIHGEENQSVTTTLDQLQKSPVSDEEIEQNLQHKRQKLN